MYKRGQVTVFVVVGVVLVLLAVMVFLYSSGNLKNVVGTKNVNLRLSEVYDSIKAEQIDKCIDKETREAVKLLLENGGSFEPSNFISYHGKKVAVLCQAIPEKNTCLSTPLFLNVIERKLTERLNTRISSCIDLSGYRGKDYDISDGKLTTAVKINPKNVKVVVNYPITISSGVVTFTKENYIYNVDVPVGEMVKVVGDILNLEATVGSFPVLEYGILSLNKYNVEIKKPYPNKIYSAGLTNSDYKIWFAVTGNNRFIEK